MHHENILIFQICKMQLLRILDDFEIINVCKSRADKSSFLTRFICDFLAHLNLVTTNQLQCNIFTI